MQIPWKAAPKAALSSPLTLLVSVVTALLLSFVVAAAVMHSSASGSAALDYEQGRLCEQTLHPALDARGGFTPDEATHAIATARAEAGDQPVLAATYTQVVRRISAASRRSPSSATAKAPSTTSRCWRAVRATACGYR